MNVDGARLRAIRLRRGFSQEQLATRSGYDAKTVRRIEQGLHQPQPRTLKDLADALAVDTAELCSTAAPTLSAENGSSDSSENESAASPLRAALLGVPRGHSMVFVGRDHELAELEKALTETTYISVQASVEGLAGIGKTELALQLVHKLAHEGRFPGGIFWLDAEDPDLRSTWGTSIADGLGIAVGPDEERCAQVIRHLTAQPEPLLIVLDNVTAWAPDSHPAPLPSGSHVRLLVTTRMHKLGGTQFKAFPVSFLQPPHDRELVTRIAEDAGRMALPGLSDVVAYLGGHALALELAGAYLGRFKTQSPQHYLERLQRGEPPPERVTKQLRYQRTVDQALEAMWEPLSSELRHAWQLCAHFEPVVVSSELSEAAGLSEELRAELADLHLIEVGDTGAWKMHRLVADFGRRAGTEADRTRARKHFRARDLYERAIEASTHILGEDHPDTLFARSDLGWTLYAQGNLEGARTHLHAVLEASTRVLGEEHPDTLSARNDLGWTLYAKGDLEGARTHQHAVLEASTRILGEEHPDTLSARNNLAWTLRAQGDLEAAHTHQEAVLEASTRILGEEHPGTLIARNNLAVTLRAQGDLERAREHLHTVLEASTRILGEEHPGTLTARTNLALTLSAQGDIENARTHQHAVLEASIRILGAEHPDTLSARTNLALTLSAQGDLEAAHTHQRTVVEASTRILGEEHPGTLTARNNLAVTLRMQGDLERAREHLHAVLEARTPILGKEHPHTTISAWNLLRTVEDQGDRTGVRAILECHLVWLLDSHPETLGSDQRTIRSYVAEWVQLYEPRSSGPSLARQAFDAIKNIILLPRRAKMFVSARKRYPFIR